MSILRIRELNSSACTALIEDLAIRLWFTPAQIHLHSQFVEGARSECDVGHIDTDIPRQPLPRKLAVGVSVEVDRAVVLTRPRPAGVVRHVREATAAGAGALLSTPENTRQAYLIVDVGAGTTDVAGFICVNNPDWDQARVFEISNAATAMNKAGNMLDQLLHKYILDRSSLTQDGTEYRSAGLDIRRQRRALKEQLFSEGRLVVVLPTDEAVEVELEAFLELPQVRNFAKSLHDLVAQSAAVVAGPASRIKLVATGGGSRLPFVTELAEKGVQLGERHIGFELVEAMPNALAETNPGLSDAFPQVAVAFGGSLPELPEQRASVATGIEQAPKRAIAPMYRS